MTTFFYVAQTKLLVGGGEPSGNNETDDVGETGRKDCNLFFTTHFSLYGEERFLLALFTGDKLFVTFFRFFIDGIGVLDRFMDGINLLSVNIFSKLRIACIL